MILAEPGTGDVQQKVPFITPLTVLSRSRASHGEMVDRLPAGHSLVCDDRYASQL